MHMRIHSWHLALGIVGVSAVAVVACTSTTTVNGGSGDDASTDAPTTTTEPDAGDAATPPATDSSTTVGTDAGEAGVVCDVPDGSDTCDTCALTSCCNEENTCQSEPADDAGSTDCDRHLRLRQDCLAPRPTPASTPEALSDCATRARRTRRTQGTTDFTALSTCLATNCTSLCQ